MRCCRFLLSLLACCWLLTSPANGQWEFDWVPSGVIDVGDRASEAAGRYDSDSAAAVKTLRLGFPDGELRDLDGRPETTTETFVIRPASYRLGPAKANLVIVKWIDSADAPDAATVYVNDEKVGTWDVRPPAGERRLHAALFAIPRTLFKNRQPPPEAAVRLEFDRPHASLGYRFYATRDWDLFAKELAGDVQAAAANARGGERSYLEGVICEANHDWAGALERYAAARDTLDGKKRTAELARVAHIAHRRAAYRALRAKTLAETEPLTFETHYRLGLLAGALGVWEDALAEHRAAVELNPGCPDATYRLAEAMEYCRMPIAEWAPLYERAGMLGADSSQNVEDVLVAVHLPPREGMCGKLSAASMAALQRDWRYVEQLVYGASRGAWKLNTTYLFADEQAPPWVMQAGWIFLPPDEAVAYQGQYDYSIGTAEYGSSHAGGTDCGVAGSGGAQIGAQRGWEVWLHEWNHQFDWVFLFGETGPGYPVTHDSDGCGKQPIVSMGCGHRSSMRYYVTRKQYQRHCSSDRVRPEGFVGEWQVGGVVLAPTPQDDDVVTLERWLEASGRVPEGGVDQLREQWERERRDAEKRAAQPPPIASNPPAKPVPDWPEYLRARWNRISLLNELVAPNEPRIASGLPLSEQLDWRSIDADPNFIDLAALAPDAPEKCVAYARSYVYSPIAQEVRVWLGYNDTAAFWVNGRQLTTGRYYACARWEDLNRPYMLCQYAQLEAGWNSFVIKVERGGGDWGFGVHVVDFDNQPLPELEFAAKLPEGEKVARYQPPVVGVRYRWEAVKDDYVELLPRLDEASLRYITGISGLELDPHRYLLKVPGREAAFEGSRYVGNLVPDDHELNNYLDWDWEAAAALRYRKGDKLRDLLLIRPEYYDEFLTLLQEAPVDEDDWAAPDLRVLGYWHIAQPHYKTIPNVTPRNVLVIETLLGDYPREDLDLLLPRTAAQEAAQSAAR